MVTLFVSQSAHVQHVMEPSAGQLSSSTRSRPCESGPSTSSLRAGGPPALPRLSRQRRRRTGRASGAGGPTRRSSPSKRRTAPARAARRSDAPQHGHSYSLAGTYAEWHGAQAWIAWCSRPVGACVLALKRGREHGATLCAGPTPAGGDAS